MNDTTIDAWVQRLLANKDRIFRWMWIPQLLVGVLFLSLAYATGHDRLRLVQAGVRTSGRVIDHRAQTFVRSRVGVTNTSTVFMPIVEFSAGAQVIRFEDWLGSASRSNLHDRVTVLYDPVKPKVATIDRPVMNWMPWMPMAGIGAILCVASAGGLLRARR
jgi:Protein of unknown function (DUF3592).